MAVTPEEVRNKQFTTSRFKEGYDLDEVDDFLDAIEETLTALTKEASDLRATAKGEIPSSIREEISNLNSQNASLKNELAQAQRLAENLKAENESLSANAGGQVDTEQIDRLTAQLAQAQTELAAAREQLSNAANGNSDLSGEIARLNAAVEQLTAANGALAQENEQLKNVTPAMSDSEASLASVRILELAQRTADEAVATARIESENLRNAAEVETADLVNKTNSEVERLMNETKANIANMTREFEVHKSNMERRVEELRAYEREYRSRLRSYLEGQLRELEGKNLGGDRQVEG